MSVGIFAIVGMALFVLLVGIMAMVMGVFLRGKPITHCGAGELTYKGEKISCPACQDQDQCLEEDKAEEAPSQA